MCKNDVKIYFRYFSLDGQSSGFKVDILGRGGGGGDTIKDHYFL